MASCSFRDRLPREAGSLAERLGAGMASTLTTAAKVVLFGDFSTDFIRDAGPLVLARTDDRWIDTHQVGFLAFQRTDGRGGVERTSSVRLRC